MMGKNKISGSKIIIFGGLGFIGRNLTAKLIEDGSRVKIVERDLTGVNFDVVQKIPNLSLEECDISDRETVKKVIDTDTKVIFNLAAHSGPKSSLDYPYLDFKVNVLGALNILEGARKCKDSVVVFISSRLVYGNASYLPIDEKHPINPTTIYGVDKFSAERYHIIYFNQYGLKTVVFRGANPYGPHIYNPQPSYNIINFFMDQALLGNKIKIFGEGSQMRDYIFIDDFSEAMIKASVTPSAYGEVFNLGIGEGLKLRDAAGIIVETVGQGGLENIPWPKELLEIETGDYVSDISKIKKYLNWEPQISFKEGVKRTLQSMKNEKSLLGKILQI